MAHTAQQFKAYQFFRENAGYVVGFNAAGALKLAKAEQVAHNMNWQFDWADDWDADHQREFDYQPSTCESCLLRDADDHILASLGCIDDATPEYRRVIEAELALEAEHDLDREIETLDAH